jgi:hypothetical protein
MIDAWIRARLGFDAQGQMRSLQSCSLTPRVMLNTWSRGTSLMLEESCDDELEWIAGRLKKAKLPNISYALRAQL